MSFDPTIHSPTHIQVNLAHLEFNFQQVQHFVKPAKVISVIKSNGYGHGLISVAQAIEKNKTDMFAVAYIEEAIELRKAGITTPIMIFNTVSFDQFHALIEYDVQTTIYDFEQLAQLDAFALQHNRRIPFHINIDTGMQRLGFQCNEIQLLCMHLQKLKKIQLLTVFSHFSCGDDPHDPFSFLQLDQFNQAISYLKNEGGLQFESHIANSGGILNFPQIKFDYVRAGIILYGVYPSQLCTKSIQVKPVLSLHSKVVKVKTIEAGSFVSYGRHWQAKQKTQIATIAIGYGHGFSRFFSHEKGRVIIKDKIYKIVGSVCMDHCMIDVKNDQINRGENVVLIGAQNKTQLLSENLASFINTIPYEILTQLNFKIPHVNIDTYQYDA